MKQKNEQYLTCCDTNVFKGLAILLMLWHHVFYQKQGMFDEFLFLSYGTIEYTRVMAKLCVSIFVFFSGYGLAVKVEQNGGEINIKDYYLRRFAKLYVNYWFVWLMFVPVSVFYFHRTLEMAYGTHVWGKAILDFLGMIYSFTGSYPYNPTWWFYSCIILLYLIFPFLYRIVKRDVLYALLLCICLKYFPLDFLNPIRNYIYIFLAGMVFVTHGLLKNENYPHYSWKKSYERTAWLILLAISLVERNNVGQLADGVITCALVKLYTLYPVSEYVKSTLAYLGIHSMNMFLIHTFFFDFWFSSQLYSLRNPIAIFLSLLVICLVVSIGLEEVKKFMRINKLIRSI